MIMALVFPELMVTWALRQLFSAHQVTRQFKDVGYPRVHPEQEKSEAHKQREDRFLRFLRLLRLLPVVLAKGVLSVPKCLWHFSGALAKLVKRSVKAHFSEQSEDYTWTHTHSFFVLMGGFMIYVDETPYHTPQPDEVLKLIRAGCIDAPTLTAKQIHDRSKGNVISKGLIMLQVAWFVMQLITRAIYHLETSQLEVGTLAFAVLDFLIYAVWWNKPLNVQCPYPVYWKSTDRPEIHIGVSERSSAKRGIFVGPIAELMGLPEISSSQKFRVPTFDGSIKLEYSDWAVLQFAALFMATTFGGIHCMAWFFAFPTYQEQVLWRMSAVAITCTPWLSLFTVWLLALLKPPDAMAQMIAALYAILYVTARAILLVLMFTTLQNLPPDVYKAVSWTTLVPHL